MYKTQTVRLNSIFKKTSKLIYFIYLLVLFSSQTLAQDSTYFPPQLEPWITWVKDRHPEWQCANFGQTRECVWEGKCSLEFKEKGLKFILTGELLDRASIRLVGSRSYPPSNVKVISGTKDNQQNSKGSELIFENNEAYYIDLPKGEFVVEGELNWDNPPQEIPVPDSFALIKVLEVSNTNNQIVINNIKRSNNALWFKNEQQSADIDKVNLSVARKFTDGSPLMIETLLDLNISGSGRSVNFGKVIPNNSLVVGITSPLPYQLNSEGVLSVQVSPGSYQITVTSTMPQPVVELKTDSSLNEIWPKEETWVWTPNNNLRTISIDGGSALSADSTLIPQDWKNNAAYVVNPIEGLVLKELSRGDSSTNGNNLYLNRIMWLDLSGEGFTINDNFSGSFKDGERLNAEGDLKVGRVAIDSKPVLITEDPSSKKTGVEIRKENLNLFAVSKAELKDDFSAIGWDQNVQQLNLQLNLPPFWKVFSVNGIINERLSWIGSWSLLEIFLLILLVIGTAKLLGKATGALVAASLLLNHNEFLEPKMLLFHILIASVICKLIEGHEGFIKQLSSYYLISSILLWCAEALTLMKLQLTQILYPQLESGTRYRTLLQNILLNIETSPYQWLAIVLVSYIVFYLIKRLRTAKGFFVSLILLLVIFGLSGSLIGALFSSAPVTQRRNYSNVQAPSANTYETESFMGGEDMVMQSLQKSRKSNLPVLEDLGRDVSEQKQIHADKVQTGPAIPKWRWRTFNFSFLGPVSADHKVSFTLLSPRVNQGISILRLITVILLMFCLLSRIGITKIKDLVFGKLEEVGKSKELIDGAIKTIVLAILFFIPKFSYSDIPDSNLLNELDSRLSKQICSGEKCSKIKELSISINKQEIAFSAKSISDGVGAVFFPGPISEYSLKSVTVNGKESFAIKANTGGFLAVKVPNGESIVEVKADILNNNPITLQFSSNPIKTSFSSSEWRAEGILPSGSISESIRFIPIKQNQEEIIETKADLESWFVINRKIEIGEKSRILTTINRIGDNEDNQLLRLQLLENEQISEGAFVGKEGDTALIKFPAQTNQISLLSTLPKVNNLKLIADETKNISYVWNLECSQYVHCSYKGLQSNESSNGGDKLITWMPFPKDKVDIDVIALNPVPGESLTVDELTHTVNWGFGNISGRVDVKIRNTAQTSFDIEIPESLKIKNLSLNNSSTGTISAGVKGSYLLQPGEQTLLLEYEGQWQPNTLEEAPLIKTSSKANNVNIKIAPSPDRWIFWVGGADWGPAVLIWSKLIVILLLIIVIGRYKFINLSIFNCVFLAIGLTTLSSLTILIPVVWLAFINLIHNDADKLKNIPKNIKIVALTLVSLLAFALFYSIVETGLVFQPPMLVVGNNSNSSLLNWYIDHTENIIPQPWVFSVSLFWWRTLMILWSTWLAVKLLEWIKLVVEGMKKIS